jgi:hypothetical protein
MSLLELGSSAVAETQRITDQTSGSKNRRVLIDNGVSWNRR